ncbi:sensor domain-containing diguanylate cyclase [Orrella sp. JC864]|uniref:sensor domain-containing diguanylate cyclase n=1 Tax=Orrella sp. JC864 TaxID=3120298 RepID=UPI0012BD3CAA
MKKPPIPADEIERQRAVDDLLLRDAALRESLQRVVQVLHMTCKPRMAALTVIDGDMQRVINRVGTSLSESSRDIAFCSHAILSDEIMVVQDARNDERFHDNPMVTAAVDPIRHYAGVPIRGRGGKRVGVLCMMDSTPHELADASRQMLIELGAVVQDLIRLHGQTLYDPLSGAYQRKLLKPLLGREWLRADTRDAPLALLAFNLDCFRDFNERYGFSEGDRCLQVCAGLLRDARRQAGDAVIRTGGEEFLMVLADADAAQALQVAEAVRLQLHKAKLAHDGRPADRLTASIGVLSLQPGQDRVMPVQAMMTVAQALAHAKRSGKDCIASVALGGAPQVHICAEYEPD